eukprot:gene23123-29316_t
MCFLVQQCNDIVELDFLTRLVELIESSDEVIQEQAIWILDNIGAEGTYRLNIIEYGAVEAIIDVLNKAKPPKIVDVIAAKALNTFTAGGVFHFPDHAILIKELLRIIARLLHTPHKQTTISSFACSTLANLTEEEEVQQETINEVFALPEILTCLAQLVDPKCKIQEVQTPAIDALSHLASSTTEDHVAMLTRLGIMPHLRDIINGTKQKTTIVRVLRCISHICAGPSDAIEEVQKAGMFPDLIAIVSDEKKNYTIRLHAAYGLLFACHGANLYQTQYLVDRGLIPVLCDLLFEGSGNKEQKGLAFQTLRSLEALLSSFNFISDFEYVNAIFTKADGWTRVTALRASKEEDIRGEAIKLDENKIRDSYKEVSVVEKEATETAESASDVHKAKKAKVV